MCSPRRVTHAGGDGVVVASLDDPTWQFEAITTSFPVLSDARPTLVEGTQLLGRFEGSGYREPPHLVARADAQLVRLPDLLHLLVVLLADEDPDEDLQHVTPPDGGYRTAAEVADALSRETGDQYGAEHVIFLLDRKLAPLGLAHYSDGTAPEVPKSNPFLSLRLRTTVLGEAGTWRIAGLFSWLFAPIVMALVLGAFFLAQVWLVTDGNAGAAMSHTLTDPVGVLIVLLLAIASAGFHEFGHASACRYGGVAPGTMGAGIYLVWPAFFTDITRTYQLGRAGRIRADLGGVYFNALFVVGLVATYLGTGYQPLIVAIVAANLEIVQQLLPSLRFDGYYIIADLAGIPDLFKYIGPILRRVLLRRPAEPRLQELKVWPQRLVTAWVVLVVPALALQMFYIISQLPLLVRTAIDQSRFLIAGIGHSGNAVLDGVTAGIQILFLALPVVGVMYVAWSLLKTAIVLALRRLRRTSAPEQRTASPSTGRHRAVRPARGSRRRGAASYPSGASTPAPESPPVGVPVVRATGAPARDRSSTRLASAGRPA